MSLKPPVYTSPPHPSDTTHERRRATHRTHRRAYEYREPDSSSSSNIPTEKRVTRVVGLLIGGLLALSAMAQLLSFIPELRQLFR
jgi:hypothetical protein